MSKYLDKFRSTMPAVQGKQVLQLLNNMKDRGEITSVTEYNKRLQELTEHLRGTDPKPIFKYFQAKTNEVIDSDRFNAMVESAIFDLETAFQEADNVAEVLELHKSLYRLTVLKSLEKAVNDLERTISMYEFFNRDLNGFTQAQFNTFNEPDSFALKRTTTGASGLFYDANNKESVTYRDDCQIDLLGQQLVMPADYNEEIKVVNVSIVDDEDTTVSIRNVQQVTSSLQNLRDQKTHTYWIYPVMLSAPVAGGVKIKIKLDLGGMREFNAISIEPACPYPMILEKISYISADNLSRDVTLNTNITGSINLNLGGLEAQYITLTFLQETVETTIYNKNVVSSMWERIWLDEALPEDTDAERISRIAEDLRKAIPDDEMQTILDIDSVETTERINAYQYTFGFDNIRIYLTKYRPRGIFVGEKFSVDNCGLIGLRATEDNPTIQIGNTNYPQFSFEYNVIKFDYDSAGAFISKEIIPILPIEYEKSISYERLFLKYTAPGSSVPDTMAMRFTPDTNTSTPVLKSNLITTLAIGTDYEVLVEGDDWTTGWQTSWANVWTRIEARSALENTTTVYIKLYDPNILSVYTINYTASARNTDDSDALPRKLLQYVTLTDGFILRCSANKGRIVARSDLYLVVIMRNNYVYQTDTCALTDYKLLTSSYDTSKFEG